MFLGFVKFYHWFIQGFSQIAAPLTLILKTLGSIKSLTRPGKGAVRIGGDSRDGRDGSKLDRSKLNGGEIDGSEVEVDEVGKKV